jgi:uncharacterized protein (TIGR00251 family)
VFILSKSYLNIRVITNAREISVEQLSPTEYRVKLRAKPIKGAANRELIAVLADHFKRPKSSIRIIRGEHSKNKVVEIAE